MNSIISPSSRYELIEGTDYHSNCGRFIYTTNIDLRFDLRSILSYRHFKIFSRDNLIGEANNSILLIKKGYAWNGASFCPDEGVMTASLLHDFLYQIGGIKNIKEFGLSRERADKCFYAFANTPAIKIYYPILKSCGWMFYGKRSNDVTILCYE